MTEKIAANRIGNLFFRHKFPNLFMFTIIFISELTIIRYASRSTAGVTNVWN